MCPRNNMMLLHLTNGVKISIYVYVYIYSRRYRCSRAHTGARCIIVASCIIVVNHRGLQQRLQSFDAVLRTIHCLIGKLYTIKLIFQIGFIYLKLLHTIVKFRKPCGKPSSISSPTWRPSRFSFLASITQSSRQGSMLRV